ncbi:MAG TPA: alpha-amylase family glycosyl hydrolase [archaeon]|nr:alpha-amylase family glycosyl hydrolase [archaeon]
MSIPVRFVYLTGIDRDIFRNVRLSGSWDINGRYADQWTSVPMEQITGEDGCPCFRATVEFDDYEAGRQFYWRIILDSPAGNGLWGIPTEVNHHDSNECHRIFVLRPPDDPGTQEERYYLTHCRRLGANKHYSPDRDGAGIRFAVWAPNAENVELVFGDQQHGYIADDGSGIDPEVPPIPMFRREDGVWETDITVSPELAVFFAFDHRPYMFRIKKKNGRVSYRTDLYSRCQIGSGKWDPDGDHYCGDIKNLDGTRSCSVVIDPETVTREFQEQVWPELEFVTEKEFWEDEFDPDRPLPDRIEDLVIYELHIGAVWNCGGRSGDLSDAIELLDYISDLGVNAIELLPMNEFEGWAEWGYGTSHYFAIEYSSGGRDQFKHFVRECHRQGMAVILDVVYNHYHHTAERAEWAYDSDIPEENIYYWYEGNASDYPNAYPPGHGGYIDNMSTGYAPRYYEEMVRKMFISSAAELIEKFHIDGFRFDQTTSMHLYNVLHSDGRNVDNANIFGAKFLRELTRTLKLIEPAVILTAEDHSEWDMVTRSPDVGGLGFDAAWYVNFYHHLLGDTGPGRGAEFAKLIMTAGYGDDQSLAMDYFAGALAGSGQKKVVYHESHDEAGNSKYSHRTIVTAVNSAPLIGETRRSAEARCRFTFGMSMLSPGTPLFLMGEEIGARKEYKYNTFLKNRENLQGERQGEGRRLFKFYQDLIRFRLSHPGLRSHEIDIVHVHNANRVIAFRRWDETEELLIVASLNNHPYMLGYTIENLRSSDGLWSEIFNSDAGIYGGNNIGNFKASIPSSNGRINAVIPANGFVAFRKEGPST